MFATAVMFSFLTGFSLGVFFLGYVFVRMVKTSDDRKREADYARELIDSYETKIYRTQDEVTPLHKA